MDDLRLCTPLQRTEGLPTFFVLFFLKISPFLTNYILKVQNSELKICEQGTELDTASICLDFSDKTLAARFFKQEN